MRLSRRDLLQDLGTATLAPSAVPVLYGQPKTKVPDVKVTGLRVYALPSATYVKVESDAGVSGWGEGEHEYTKWQFRDLITIGNPDMLNLDTIKCGGITECRKVAAMAEAFNKEVMVHNTRPTLATAASLHLCASIANAARRQEFSGLRPELNQSSLFENSLRFQNGFLYVPDSPGLGLTVNEQEMERRNLLR